MLLLLNLFGCKESKKNNPSKNSSIESSVQKNMDSNDETSSYIDGAIGDIGEIDSGFANVGNTSENSQISDGYYENLEDDLEIPEDDLEIPEEDLEIPEEDWEIPEEDWELPEIDLSEYESPIPMTGTKVEESNKVRKLKVETKNKVHKNFRSFGGNIFPALISDEGKEKSGMNEALFEIEKKRFVSAKPQVNRMLFNVDYMMTNNGDPIKDKEDWENGVYSLNNDKIDAVIEYIEMIGSYGGAIELNFGWKAANRIQDWYSLSDINPAGSAPANLKAYAKACGTLLEYLIEDRDYSQIKAVSFSNEIMAENQDFDVLGDKADYYFALVRFVSAELKSRKLHNKVEIWGFENNHHTTPIDLAEKCSTYLGTYTFHHYYHELSTFAEWFELGETLKGSYKLPAYLGECSVGIYELKDLEETFAGYSKWGWENNTTALFIALANSGVTGGSFWTYATPYWSDPLLIFAGEYDQETTEQLWQSPVNNKQINQGMRHKFYSVSMLSNYIKADSTVLQVYWEGEDIRFAAFELSDGNLTLVVEAKETGKQRNLEFEFDDEINKTFYKIEYKPETLTTTASAIVPRCVDTFKDVGDTLKDSVDGKYATYIYTTMKPIKQIDFGDAVAFECDKTGSLELPANLIDCEQSDEVIWSISKSTNESAKGSVDQNGKYTPDADAQSGDMIAVRASLKSDLMVYNVAVITIK